MQEGIPENIRVAARKLPAIRAAAKRLRLPLDEADLRPNPPVSAVRNAAPLYRQAAFIARQIPKPEYDADMEILSECLKPQRQMPALDAARKAMVRRANLFQLATNAASRPDCDFRRDFSGGPNTPFPEYATMRNLARMFAVQALLHVQAKNPLAALSTIRNGIVLARHVGQDPFLIAYLVRIMILAVMDVPFRQVLWQFGNRSDVLTRAAQIHRFSSGLTDPRPALKSEAFISAWVGKHTRNGGDMADMKANLLPNGLSKQQVRKVFADAFEARLLEFWTTTVPEMERPGATLRSMDKTLTQVIAHQVRAAEGVPPDDSYKLAAILHPVFADAAKKAMQMEAVHRVRFIAIDALRERIAGRGFPERLPQVQEASDPFTDRSLLYRRSGSGFLVYSVSANGKDDGGNEGRDATMYPKDIVFRYP
jgi:hypothetical protein